MKKLHIKDPKKLLKNWRLETGFSMLEAVVVVGVLLAIAVGGFFAYGPITENAKKAALASAASQVHTAVMVASIDGDPATQPQGVIDTWNASNSKIRASIVNSEVVVVGAMTTADPAPTEGDLCVQTEYIADSDLTAQAGTCDEVSADVPIPEEEVTPAPPVAAPAGYIASWGYNASGQLGTGDTFTSTSPRDVLTTGVLAGKKITDVSASSNSTCAIAEGAAYCWGLNNSGQIGNNTTVQSAVPVAVNVSGALAGKTVTAVSTGSFHACAIADGTVFCWGNNDNGQLGNNSNTKSLVPVAVDVSGVLAGKTITAISSGNYHSCAIADATVYCWGQNSGGQLGNNTTINSSVPVAVNASGALSGKKVTAVTAVDVNNTCAVADGAAYCWGYNSSGQLGNNSTTQSLVPVAVNTSGALAGKTVTAISSGNSHICVIADGAAYCWGYNYYGQLGNNATANMTVPVAVNTSGVLAGKTVTDISAGGNHTCVVADDAAYCWGQNNSGELGDTTKNNSSVPVAVDTSGVLSGKKIITVSVGSSSNAVIYA